MKTLLITTSFEDYKKLKEKYYVKDEDLRGFVEKDIFRVTFDGDLYTSTNIGCKNNEVAFKNKDFYQKESDYSVLNISKEDLLSLECFYGQCLTVKQKCIEENLVDFLEDTLADTSFKEEDTRYYIVPVGLADISGKEVLDTINSHE